MEINYLGHSCFRIKGKKVIVVTDPFSDEIGLKMPRVSADIVTVSHDHQDHNNVAAIGKTTRRDPFVVSKPGEYEISDVFVFGAGLYHDTAEGKKRGKNTAYVISLDGLRLAHLGDLGHKLSDDHLEEINGVDILFIPVGDTFTIGPKEAVAVVGQIEPKIVIPMHYSTPGLKYDLLGVEKFLKEIGSESKPTPKLMISKESLPEEREVVILKRKL
jgi:L-ascorbate metabolism protein UlaG (beta-lactamase superfamily)